MEREFGEKSFRPSMFEFRTIYAAEFNPEYHNLFTRKLPGQILLLAYDTSRTVRELALELGVASVYLEDELRVLEKYQLIVRLPSAKYQANLIIFTEGFWEEFCREAEKSAVPALEKLLSDSRGRLLQIREAVPACRKLAEDRMLWALLWLVMRQGSRQFEAANPEYQTWDKIYGKKEGINYGVGWDCWQGEYGCCSFAGYADIDDRFYASAADFGILPEKNRYFGRAPAAEIAKKVELTLTGELSPEFLILTEAEEIKMQEILQNEVAAMASLYDALFRCTCGLMRVHTPEHLTEQIDRFAFKTLFFQTVGLIGYCAVKSQALLLPEFDGPTAVYIRIKGGTGR